MSSSDQCVYRRGWGSFVDVLEPSASLSGSLQTSKVSAPVLLQLQRRVPRLYLPIDCVLLCSKILAPSLQVPVVTPTHTTTPPPPTTTKAPVTTTKAPATTTKAPASTVAATAPPVLVSGARAPPVAVSGARGPATAAPLAGAPVTTSTPAVPVTTSAPAVTVTTKAPAVPVTVAPATTRIITPGTPIGQVPAKDQAAVAAALAKGDTVVIEEAPAAPVRLHCIPAPAQHNIHGAGSLQGQH